MAARIAYKIDVRPSIRVWFRNYYRRYIDPLTGELNCTLMAEDCIIDLDLDLIYNDDELEFVSDMAVDLEKSMLKTG